MSTAPVTKLDARVARNSAAPMISSGSATRPSNVSAAAVAGTDSSPEVSIRVANGPGAMAFTRTPSGASSVASTSVA